MIIHFKAAKYQELCKTWVYLNCFAIVLQRENRHATEVLVFQSILYMKIFSVNGLGIFVG